MPQDVVARKSPPPNPIVQNGNGAPAPRTASPGKKQSRWGLWLGLVVILLLAGAAVTYFESGTGQKTSASDAKPGGAGDKVQVVGVAATKGNIGVYLTGLGTVTPLNTVTVKTRVNGQLMKVLFLEGQMVKEGDPLVQIDPRPYEVQLAQYKAQLVHDQALLDNAKIDEQRYETLWKQDSIPQQQLATQQALVKQDQGTVDGDQAQIDSANLNITYCNITAPVSGRVGLRLVDQGNYVQTSDTNGLLVITQMQPITVVFTIPEDSIQPVLDKLNSVQSLPVEAYDRDMTQKLADGTLLTTDNQIDPTTGTLKLKAIFPNGKTPLYPNASENLFPNQFVNVRLLVETKQNVTLIPVTAIQHGTQGTFVFVVDTNAGTVKMANITVGTTEGGNAEIVSGVAPGDTVVTDGVDKLKDGSAVILAPSTSDKKQTAPPADGSTP